MGSCFSGQQPHHAPLIVLQGSTEGCLAAPGPDPGGGEHGDQVPGKAFVPGASLWVTMLLRKALVAYDIYIHTNNTVYNTVTYDLGPGSHPGAGGGAALDTSFCLSCAEGEAVARGLLLPVHLEAEVWRA